MKKLLCIAALALVALVSANAQQYEVVTLFAASTNSVAASGTSNYTATAYVAAADWVSIYTTHKLQGTGTDNTIFRLSKSVDGVTYETTPSINITNVNNGVTAVATVTDVQTKGSAWIKLASIVNGDTGDALTNIVVKVGIKAIN